MAAVFNISDVSKIRKISTSFDPIRFDAFAMVAQDENLRLWLGDELHNDFITNIAEAKHQTLLNGEVYNGKKFYGLKQYLCYAWLFINAIEGDDFQSNVGTVNFGQQPNYQHPKGKSLTIDKYSDSMNIYKENAIAYLNEKAAIYPLWQSTDLPKGGASLRFIRI